MTIYITFTKSAMKT